MDQKKVLVFTLMILTVLTIAAAGYQQLASIPVVDDPLVRMPGTQPGQVSLESSNRCLNCHAGYNQDVEPGFNWMGSMMAQSARDFMFWSAFTVAGQDSMAVLGSPNAMDLCERCHFPKGWLEGRSDPPNASLMTGADYDGVQCDFCHRMYDPFYETTFNGTREGADWLNYWDETNASGTPSGPAAQLTYNADAQQAAAITTFTGGNFFVNNLPFSQSYTENGSGQFFVSANAEKRASFADAEARHQMLYSRHHKSKYFCNACHDVSNPVLANLGDNPSQLTTEHDSAFSYYHVERTFSEFMSSAYGQQGGTAGVGPFSPEVFQTSDPNNFITACQDCHMRDVGGTGANKRGVPYRPTDSIEHPNSGQPLHDLTGGNVWVSTILASAVQGSPNFNQTNSDLLNQGPTVLTLDLTQGQGINPSALLAGADRAMQQLQLAASIQDANYDSDTGALSFKVVNQTGHRLISGFPEGRRMFVNIIVYDVAGNVIYQINPYDNAAGTLKGLAYTYNGLVAPEPLTANETYLDALVYEMHPSSTITNETETFHFVLADGRYKDNRIPPQGYDVLEAATRQAEPVWHGVSDPAYFTNQEYAGGFDQVDVMIPSGGNSVEINLYYQTTSREYIEFLRDEINGTGTTLAPGDYIVQTDPFFSQLKAWGDTIWQLWLNNMNLPGGSPILMTQTTVGGMPSVCSAPAPSLLSASPGHTQVTLNWNDVFSANPDVQGFNVYYDQAGKSQWVATTSLTTTFTDTGLTNGQEYCYKVTSFDSTCESSISNVICAIPANDGQNPGDSLVSVESITMGVITGKGKNQTFITKDPLDAGDTVIAQVRVVDDATNLPLENAVVDLIITGPESVSVTSGQSNQDGIAYAQWQTQAPNKKGANGTTPGIYTITVTNISLTNYTWDGVATAVNFTIQ